MAYKVIKCGHFLSNLAVALVSQCPDESLCFQDRITVKEEGALWNAELKLAATDDQFERFRRFQLH